MTKRELLEALEGSVAGQLVEFLPAMSELGAADATRARLALRLAGVIDEGGDEFTAALVKEFRGTLRELEDSIGAADNDASDFWQRMSSEMGHTADG